MVKDMGKDEDTDEEEEDEKKGIGKEEKEVEGEEGVLQDDKKKMHPREMRETHMHYTLHPRAHTIDRDENGKIG